MKKLIATIGVTALMLSATAFANPITVKTYKVSKKGNGVDVGKFEDSIIVKMYKVSKKGKGAYIGEVEFADTTEGLLIEPQLFGLTPGMHGFHVHTNPTCANMGKAAGGHLDPLKTKKHLGPTNKEGHLGDLPVLIVASDGKTHMPSLATRLTVKDLKGHAIMIHLYGDNYSDKPKPNGGGGPRYACAVVK